MHSHLKEVPGIRAFSLLKGPERADQVLFAAHRVWASRDAFEAWKKPDDFRLAHRNAGDNSGLYLAHPGFEGFDVVQERLPRPV